MVDQKLVDYIEEVVHRGVSVKQAEDKLIQAGYKKSDIKKAASKVKRKRFEEVGAIILGVIIVIGLLGLIIDKLYYEEVVEEPKSSFESLKDAIESGDISACDQFNPVKKDVCRKTILGELGGDNPPNLPKEEPIIEQARQLQDPSLCEDIDNVIQKDRCLIASGAKEAPTVERYYFDNETNQTLPTEYQIVEDITAEAAETGNSSLCGQITNPVKRQRCLVKSS